MNTPMRSQQPGRDQRCKQPGAFARLSATLGATTVATVTAITTVAMLSVSGCCLHPRMLDVRALKPQPALQRLEVAHRGTIAHPTLPDNSLSALRASLEAGVAFLEVDVRRSEDGSLFLFHDGSFSCSNSNAPAHLRGVPISSIATSVRRTVTIGADHTEAIPTLADALSLIEQSSRSRSLSTLQLDLKGESDALVLAVLELVRARRLLGRVLLQLRTPDRVALALSRYPQARILVRCTSHAELTAALTYPIEAVELERWISSEAIREAHSRGVLVAVNVSSSCFDTPTTHEYLRSRGVDMIMTDGAGKLSPSSPTTEPPRNAPGAL
jgi:glycerophosphoryl diester phosphodiesterase